MLWNGKFIQKKNEMRRLKNSSIIMDLLPKIKEIMIKGLSECDFKNLFHLNFYSLIDMHAYSLEMLIQSHTHTIARRRKKTSNLRSVLYKTIFHSLKFNLNHKE